MITTLSLKDIEKHADNLYEAIIVLAKRARQINDEQKQLLHRENDYDGYEDYEDEDFEISSGDINYLKLPKPTSIALEELLAGKIEYHYKVPDDEADDKDESAE